MSKEKLISAMSRKELEEEVRKLRHLCEELKTKAENANALRAALLPLLADDFAFRSDLIESG